MSVCTISCFYIPPSVIINSCNAIQYLSNPSCQLRFFDCRVVGDDSPRRVDSFRRKKLIGEKFSQGTDVCRILKFFASVSLKSKNSPAKILDGTVRGVDSCVSRFEVVFAPWRLLERFVIVWRVNSNCWKLLVYVSRARASRTFHVFDPMRDLSGCLSRITPARLAIARLEEAPRVGSVIFHCYSQRSEIYSQHSVIFHCFPTEIARVRAVSIRGMGCTLQ